MEDNDARSFKEEKKEMLSEKIRFRERSKGDVSSLGRNRRKERERKKKEGNKRSEKKKNYCAANETGK